MSKSTLLEGFNKIGPANISSTEIGFGSYIISGNAVNGKIGRFCSIGHNFQIINADHPINFVSSYPGFYKTENKDIFITNNDTPIKEHRLCSNGKSFIIGNDVWVGNNVTIMGGITISDGAVIGANALVTKNVPPYAIVGGVPAKIIKYRFSEEKIKLLMSIKWWDWDIKKIISESIYFNNVDVFLEKNK